MSITAEYGPEIGHFLTERGALYSIRATGVTLMKTITTSDWVVALRKKPEVPLATWLSNKRKAIAALPAWQLACDQLPSMEELQEWAADGICETPTGDRVEPDGHGPDGAPSWLLLLGFI